MALEVGSIVEGQVTGIARFGAFVELPEKKTGLVHISEIANEFVSDINDFLKVNDKVKVKVLSVDSNGKIALSIKQAMKDEKGTAAKDHAHEQDNKVQARGHNHHERFSRDDESKGQKFHGGFQARRRNDSGSFEDKLNRFLKDSDERLLDLKRNVESKRGGRGSRWSD